jgi:hypothetical protein
VKDDAIWIISIRPNHLGCCPQICCNIARIVPPPAAKLLADLLLLLAFLHKTQQPANLGHKGCVSLI